MSRTPPHAATEQGRYEGSWTDGVAVFRGIRFATAPTGPLRWAPPVAPEPFAGTKGAVEFGPACPQTPDWDAPNRAAARAAGVDPARVAMEAGSTGEDCLSLNIWTQAPDDGRRPVMVWIHGGASSWGSGSAALFDGSRLAAEHDVVVATINYRLGALGFLAHPELAQESPLSTAGNYGFLDQVQALRWVRANIAGFGGDPAAVTVFGESAGGRSVFELLAHPPARGLFHRAIAQSPWEEIHHSRRLGEPYAGVESAFDLGERLVGELGLGRDRVVERLRSVPANELVEASLPLGNPGTTWGPVVDGTVFQDNPLATLLRGEGHRVPLMLGFNRDEGTIFFLDPDFPLLDPGRYGDYVRGLCGDAAAEVRGRYPGSDDRVAAHRSFSELYGDRVFSLPSVAAANRMGASHPVYLYRFCHAHPPLSAAQDGRRIGCFHGSEIPLLFGTTAEAFDPADEPLGATMRAQWARFARSGSPNGEDLPVWPRYEADGGTYLELDEEIRTARDPLDGRYSLLAAELEGRLGLRTGAL